MNFREKGFGSSASYGHKADEDEENFKGSREGGFGNENSKEPFRKKTLHADTVKPENYTREFYDKDTQYLNDLLRYELGQLDFQQKELEIEKEKRVAAAGYNFELRKEIFKWWEKSLNQIFDLKKQKLNEAMAERNRIAEIFFYKRKPEEKPGGGGSGGPKPGGGQGGSKPGGQKPGGGTGGPKPGPEKPGGGKPESDREKAERVAIQELGITEADFRSIISRIGSLGDGDIIRLTTKVLQTTNDKAEVKKAFYKWAKEWHPDTGKTRFGIGVNEIKFKIANNLYTEYSRRFGK